MLASCLSPSVPWEVLSGCAEALGADRKAALLAPEQPGEPEACPEPGPYLEDSEDGSGEGVKVGCWRLILEVEPEENEKPREEAAPQGAGKTWCFGPECYHSLQRGCSGAAALGSAPSPWDDALSPNSSSKLHPRLLLPNSCWSSTPTYCPPNSCMPSRAKTTMNRKSRKRRLMMDFMELSRDTTRFLRELQYLGAEGV